MPVFAAPRISANAERPGSSRDSLGAIATEFVRGLAIGTRYVTCGAKVAWGCGSGPNASSSQSIRVDNERWFFGSDRVSGSCQRKRRKTSSYYKRRVGLYAACGKHSSHATTSLADTPPDCTVIKATMGQNRDPSHISRLFLYVLLLREMFRSAALPQVRTRADHGNQTASKHTLRPHQKARLVRIYNIEPEICVERWQAQPHSSISELASRLISCPTCNNYKAQQLTSCKQLLCAPEPSTTWAVLT